MIFFFAALVVGANARSIIADHFVHSKVCIDLAVQNYEIMTIFHMKPVDPSYLKYSIDTGITTKLVKIGLVICNHASAITIKHSIHSNQEENTYIIGPKFINMTTFNSNKTISCKEMKVNVCSGIIRNDNKKFNECVRGRSSIDFIFGNSTTFPICKIQEDMMTICKTNDFDIQTNTEDMCHNLKSKWFWNIYPSEMMFRWYLQRQTKENHCEL